MYLNQVLPYTYSATNMCLFNILGYNYFYIRDLILD